MNAADNTTVQPLRAAYRHAIRAISIVFDHANVALDAGQKERCDELTEVAQALMDASQKVVEADPYLRGDQQ